MSTPEVSVVIPVYNGEKYLAATVESALGQVGQEVEVIVVDDGSTDGTPSVLDRLRDRVRGVRQPNQGVAAARNTGIGMARGKYVAFLDADDVWLAEKLKRQRAYFDQNPRLGAVGAGYYVTDEKLAILSQYVPSVCHASSMLLGESNGGLFSSTLLVPTAVLEQVGGFDVNLSTSADWDFVTRVAMQFEVAAVPEPLVLYRLHGANMHRNVRRTERDVRLILGKAFSLPAADKVGRLRRRAYSNHYRILAGSYWHAEDGLNALRCGALSLAWHPWNALYFLRFLARLLRPAR
jgi:glycosyltransferase involved in cell wall biosynthesis